MSVFQNTFTGSIGSRVRVICDNDFQGDPDGLIQLAHLLLSDSVDTRAIIGSHLGSYEGDDDPLSAASEEAVEGMRELFNHTAQAAVDAAQKIVDLCGLADSVPVLAGSDHAIKSIHEPTDNEAVRFIIAEALREDTDLPLYVVCGAGLTSVASALLIEPRIASRLTLVWIGGSEYPGVFVPKDAPACEYNLNTDIKAGQVVFNESNVDIWQIPRNVYRQTLISKYELIMRMRSQGELGRHLYDALYQVIDFLGTVGVHAGESYVMGDSPLVLVTALQTTFEPDSASSFHEIRQAPKIKSDGTYDFSNPGRNIRVYTQVDNRLMFEDFFNKLAFFSQTRS